MKKKYELLKNDTIVVEGITLYRIKALRNLPTISKNGLGGYIECEDNLSHFGTCWVYDKAKVFKAARVYENAQVFDRAEISHSAEIYGNAKVFDRAHIAGGTEVFDNAEVYDDAIIIGPVKIWGSSKINGESYILSRK